MTTVDKLRKECIGLIGRTYIYHGTSNVGATKAATELVDALIRAIEIREENIKLDASGQRVTIDEYLGAQP